MYLLLNSLPIVEGSTYQLTKEQILYLPNNLNFK